MKLKVKIAKLDDVAEAYRGLYEARDGAFVLKDEFEIADPVDVIGLTKNRDTILAEKTALEQKFAGIDPEKAREALKKVEELPAKEKTDGDRVAALEKQMADEKAARVAADERANIQFIRSAATSAISAAKGRPGADILLMPHILGDPDSGRPLLSEPPTGCPPCVCTVSKKRRHQTAASPFPISSAPADVRSRRMANLDHLALAPLIPDALAFRLGFFDCVLGAIFITSRLLEIIRPANMWGFVGVRVNKLASHGVG